MKILALSLKDRFTGKPDVAIYEEFADGDVRNPVAWIVTSADRPGHEWRFTSAAAALSHYSDLANLRLRQSPGKYMAPVPGKRPNRAG